MIIAYSEQYRQSLLRLLVDFKQASAEVSIIFDALDDNFEEGIVDYFQQHLAKPHGQIGLAMDGEQVVGFIAGEVTDYFPFCKIKRMGHIKELYVARHYRKQGIGKQLIRYLEASFYQQGIRHIKIETIVYYPNNQHFYQSLGYETFLLDMRKRMGDGAG